MTRSEELEAELIELYATEARFLHNLFHAPSGTHFLEDTCKDLARVRFTIAKTMRLWLRAVLQEEKPQ